MVPLCVRFWKKSPEQRIADERSSALSPISGSASERDAESLAAKAGGSLTFCPVIRKEEASLRMQEAQLINRFVAKARTVVPKTK